MIKKQLIQLLTISDEDLKKTVFLKQHPQHESLFFLILNNKANTFSHTFVRDIHELLSVVEKHEGHTALLTVSLHPTVYSGGLDLNFMAVTYLSKQKNANQYDRSNFILEFIRLLGRLLSFCVPTIAIVSGHAVAGGCMFIFAQDFRFARAELGKALTSLPEIEISMYLPPGMNAVCQCKLQPHVYRDMALLARKFDLGTEGVQNHMVDGVANEDQLVELAIQKALKVSKYGVDKFNFQKIKQQVYKEAINCCFNNQLATGVPFDLGIPKL